MATVNFSVPDDVKRAFDKAFKGSNKSAIIADLMRKAVDERERQARRLALFQQLTEKRGKRPPATNGQIRALRREGRQ